METAVLLFEKNTVWSGDICLSLLSFFGFFIDGGI